jgi:hypothetical protein
MTHCILSTRLATFTEQGKMKSKQLSHTNRGANQAPLMQYTTPWHPADIFSPEHYDFIPKTQYLLA